MKRHWRPAQPCARCQHALYLRPARCHHASQTELASYLGDFTLETDTAAGALALQKLAEEHHCGATLTVEPYEGLRKVRLCYNPKMFGGASLEEP